MQTLRNEVLQRQLVKQRTYMTTAELASTFTSGVAAALVGTVWQVHSGVSGALDKWLVVVLAATLVSTVLVFMLDELLEPNLDEALDHYRSAGGMTQTPEDEARAWGLGLSTSVLRNNDRINLVNWAWRAQLTTFAISIVLSVISLWR